MEQVIDLSNLWLVEIVKNKTAEWTISPAQQNRNPECQHAESQREIIRLYL